VGGGGGGEGGFIAAREGGGDGWGGGGDTRTQGRAPEDPIAVYGGKLRKFEIVRKRSLRAVMGGG
jgi:hypothetical protein